MSSTQNHQSGNILFLILIAVALFGALSFAITSSSRQSQGNNDSENTLIASAELIQHANALENAMTYLRATNKCTVEEMSFERSPFDGSDADYVNPAAGANFGCHLFHPQGGKVSQAKPPRNANDGRDWAYIEGRVLGIGADQTACGTECHEVIAVLGGLSQDVCRILNRRFTGDATIPVQDDGTAYETNKYTGTFNAGPNIDGLASGRNTMCIEDTAGVYYFYWVLFPR